MKTLRLLFGTFGLFAFVCSTWADESVTLRTLKGGVAATAQKLEIDNSLGSVTITAVKDGFGWEWNLRGTRGRNDRVEKYAQECQLEVRESPDGLKLVVVRPDRDRSSSGGIARKLLSVVTLGTLSSNDGEVRSDLNLRVPSTSVVGVKNRFGAIHVTGTKGAATIEGQNCPVDLAEIDGAVNARTSFGHLRAQKIGPATLANQNGSINASDVAGDLQASTSFGKMKVRDVKGHATLKNQNGGIDIARVSGDLTAGTSFAELLAERIGGKAELRGQNSNITATTVTGALKAGTSFGTLSVHGLGAGAELKNQNGNIDAEAVTGDIVAETSFANLRVNEVGGSAELDCRNGKIVAERVTGGVRAKNSFGPLRVKQIGGAAELDGQNSEIVAAGVSGDIRAQTSFGRMQLDGNGRHIVAKNQNGAVEITARAPGVQHIEASASFAPINLRLPGEAKPFIRATTSFGKVYSSFPVFHSDTVSDERFAADTAPLKISLKAQNGDIRISELAGR